MTDFKKYTINFENLKEKIENKKIILFGAGIVAEKTLKIINKQKIDYILDNSKNLSNSSFFGLNVYQPKKISLSYKDQIIIICSTSFEAIINQLKKIDRKNKFEIYINPILNDRIIISEIDNLQKEIFFTSGMQPENKNLSGGGLYKIFYKNSNIKVKKIFSGNSCGILKNKKNFIITDDNHGILKFNDKMKLLSKKKLGSKLRTHGIAFSEKHQKYFVVSSFRDSVLVFDSKFKLLNEFNISEKFSKFGSAQHHCNDISVIGDYGYISMFSVSGNFRKDVFDGGIVEFDLNDLKLKNVIKSDLWMPHNVSFHGNSMTVLDSLRGNLLSHNFQVIGTFPGFTRGLDFDGRFFYIGQSRNRNHSKYLGKSDNISIDSSIIIFDPITKVSKSIFLPTDIAEIHSLFVK